MVFSYNGDLLPKVRMMGYAKYNKPWIHFSRIIDEYILYVIKHGDLYLRENDVNYHLTSGDFFLLEPNLRHEGYEKATCEYYYVHFSHSELSPYCDDKQAIENMADKQRICLLCDNLSELDPVDSISYIPKYFKLHGGECFGSLHTAVDYYIGREAHFKRRAASLFHSFLLEVAHRYFLSVSAIKRSGSKKSEIKVDELLKYLNQNYAQQFTSQSIAKLFDSNFDYLNRIFKETTGNTIFAYINNLRIHNAKQLIATTNLPISEIGYLVGFEDRYYFSKLFRKLTDLSPSQYYKKVHYKE